MENFCRQENIIVKKHVIYIYIYVIRKRWLRGVYNVYIVTVGR